MADVVDLDQVDRTQVATVGGKAAGLGELMRVDGVRVPDGFCVTTEVFAAALAGAPAIGELLDRLAGVRPDDPQLIGTLSAQLRDEVRQLVIPAGPASAIADAVARLGEGTALAVRSSATAEDRADASFAGQHDSYLDVTGVDAVLTHVGRCWASLFTERAVTYRLRHGVDHRGVRMAVVVQRLVRADAAGVLFTADPVTGDRTVTTVEAVHGLGESLVSGLVNADVYSVRRGDHVHARTTAPDRVLTDAQVLRLARLGRRIEAHAGHPQDVEWCLVGDDIRVVQSRPITTLFPVPPAEDDGNHVYVSVGHQQMMTDPIRPLGLSVWQMTTPRPMAEAGGRLFVDVTAGLGSPTARGGLLDALGKSDPRIRVALQSLLDRDGWIPSAPDAPGPPLPGGPSTIATDPAVVTELIDHTQAALDDLERGIQGLSGPALFDFIRADLGERRRSLFDPRGLQVIMAAIDATWWLNDHLREWLGEQNAADTLTQSAPHNVTSEMGLALLDVADVIRPYPDVVAFLQQIEDGGSAPLLDGLAGLDGGAEARAAIQGYLDRYGMRCVGEIDITRTRWSEDPGALVPAILSNVRNAEPGSAARRFEQGLQRARAKEQDVLARLRALPDGDAKADETARMIHRVRTFIGYREYPKYGLVCRYFVYKQALLREAERLVRTQRLRAEDDIFYLRFDELHELVRSGEAADARLVDRRRAEFDSYRALTPPRVFTSDGEVVTGAGPRDDLPPGALAGLPVSAGTVEGRARVVLDLAQADLEPGDILVTAYTDPSWTPLFVAVAGLVTEVGGVMTHGAVIAREYGLPAVVGVDDATRLIRDGQRIRLHGGEGYVELLD